MKEGIPLQVQVYNFQNHSVKLILTFQKYDVTTYSRVKRMCGTGRQYWCIKCFATFVTSHTRCPRCNSRIDKSNRGTPPVGVFRKYFGAKIKKQLPHNPLAVPVSVDIHLLHSSAHHEPDVGNVYNLVEGLLSETVIVDDSCIWKTTVTKSQYPIGPTKLDILVVPKYQEQSGFNLTPSEIVALYNLSKRFSGRMIYVPKEYDALFELCSDEVKHKVFLATKEVKQVGPNYTLLAEAVVSKYPELDFLSKEKIVAIYREIKQFEKGAFK